MDYISIHLLGLLERSHVGSERHWNVCRLTHQYLLDALRAEMWWRLGGTASAENRFVKELVAGLSDTSCLEVQQQLRACLPVVFSNDREQAESYGRLLDLMDEFAALMADTKQEYSLKERCSCAFEILGRIDALRESSISFPPLSDNWEILIPLQLEGGMWQCATYQKNTNPRSSYNYLWGRTSLSREAVEFNDGPTVRSGSRIQGGRVYFRCGTRMRCLYPFVQIGFNAKHDEVDSLWLLKSLERQQNGGCRGIDIMREMSMDYRSITEFIQFGSGQTNRYITLTKRTDEEGNTCPLRNCYNPNYPDWCGDLQTINSTIQKLKEHLNTPDCSLIYLYGHGGVGKTAAVQKLLEEFDVPKKHHEYEYIIFLSAKELEWCPTNGQTPIRYDDSKGEQSFRDLSSLRKAMHNILCSHIDGEAVQVPEQWDSDRDQLYAGKSILLVLDDYESISPETQLEIVSYLQETFYAPPTKNELLEPSNRFKRRQVIITCRDSSIECLRADILLPQLDMNETICLAKHIAKRLNCKKAYDHAFGIDGMVLSDAQERKRELFHDLSYGKPLMILSLVRNYYNADFPNTLMAEKELLEILTKDTAKYLGRDDKCHALAVLAAYLADENGRNKVERLKFLSNRLETGYDYFDQSLTLLKNYSVLQVDSQKLYFVFTQKEYQKSIVENYENTKRNRHDIRRRLSSGFGITQGTVLNLQDDLLRMAKWLRRDQHLSSEECLMYRFQQHIRQLYDTSIHDEFGFSESDIGSLADVVLNESTAQIVSRNAYRKTLQMAISVFQNFEQYEILRVRLSMVNYQEYPTEQLWGSMIDQVRYSQVPENDDEFENIINDYISDIWDLFEDTSDPEDLFVQLWGVLQLVAGFKEMECPICAAWGALIQEMLKVCASKHAVLSRTDLQVLNAELQNAERLFPECTFFNDTLKAARYMADRKDVNRLFYKASI